MCYTSHYPKARDVRYHSLTFPNFCSHLMFSRIAFSIDVLLYTSGTKESGNDENSGTSIVLKLDSLNHQPYNATLSPFSLRFRLTLDWRSQLSRNGPVVSAVAHLATLCSDNEIPNLSVTSSLREVMYCPYSCTVIPRRLYLSDASRLKSIVDALGKIHQPRTGDPVPPALFRSH